ncbi:Sister chromatid cohesion protein 2 [Podochytrium sp. JEL0797]|nr:Sister chromatid cohesion protein 2 [Podochytrium sp. JEL0797]
MIDQDSQVLMNGIFQTGLIVHRIELIKIFVEFLKMEQLRMMNEEIAKKAATGNSATVDINVLIGNAEEMADAGVSSAVMQMYLNYILDGLMSVDVVLSTTAFDAVCIIIEQGLAHPLMCVPYVIAMQTSVVPSVRDRAVLVYENLAEKHQTFIHSRTGESVRKAFEYRMNLARAEAKEEGGQVWAQGYSMEMNGASEKESLVAGPVSLLSNMFAKIQVKRPRRNDFLLALVRSFDVDISLSQDKDLIPFGRFVADNLATLNYKSVDEVMSIIYHICQVLSVSGETVLKSIEDWKTGANKDEKFLEDTAKSSILMGILVKLKMFLQQLYGLSESKCRRFTPSESTRNTEKSRPAVQQPKASVVMDWASWPFADSRGMKSNEDMVEQLDLFVELMNTDYYIGGTGDDDEDMDLYDDHHQQQPSTESHSEDARNGKDDESADIPAAIAPPADLPPATKGKKRNSLTPAGGPAVPAMKKRKPSVKVPSRSASTASKVSVETVESRSPDRPKRRRSVVSVVEASSDE